MILQLSPFFDMVQLEDSRRDLLIVRAGPTGLMAAAWAARCRIHARIIDKRGTKIFNGQADGLNCRSLEIFDSFGFADRIWKKSNHMLRKGLSWWPMPTPHANIAGIKNMPLGLSLLDSY